MSETLVGSVMCLYEEGNTRHGLRQELDSELSEEFEVKVGMHQGSVLSLFLFAVLDAVTELARDGVLIEFLYADDLILMSETIEGVRYKLR